MHPEALQDVEEVLVAFHKLGATPSTRGTSEGSGETAVADLLPETGVAWTANVDVAVVCVVADMKKLIDGERKCYRLFGMLEVAYYYRRHDRFM